MKKSDFKFSKFQNELKNSSIKQTELINKNRELEENIKSSKFYFLS